VGEEKRKYRRLPVKVALRARDSQGEGDLLFESDDLSAGGAFLRSDLLLEEDEALTIEFRIPRVLRPIRTQAKIAWVRRFPKPGEVAGMGVHFLSLEEADRAELERYLEAVAAAKDP
jgi:uncharacterized protein (TIGR02266 family)